METVAANAERASIKYKQVEFYEGTKLGQVFDGVVSGVTEWGTLCRAECEQVRRACAHPRPGRRFL